MVRKFFLAAMLAAGLSAPAAALDLSAMTEAEREAFRAEVRAYLLDNPEVLMEAIAVLEQRQAEQRVENDRQLVIDNAADLFEDQFSWVGGNPDGDVTIVEFLDYRCSFCRKAFPEVEQLIETDGNIRIIVKEYPILGDQSVAASRFAIATLNTEGSDAYKKVHDALMTARGNMDAATFGRIADELNLDKEAIFREMENPVIDTIIQRNYRLAERLSVSGTPSFVFGNEMVRGYVPLDTMLELVAALRASQ